MYLWLSYLDRLQLLVRVQPDGISAGADAGELVFCQH